MKRCCSCGRDATTGYFVCTDCHGKFPGFGIEWVQTGLNEVTLHVPENVVIKVSPMSSGRKFTAVVKRPLYDLKEKVRVWLK